jgi:hypothetical protein
LAVATAYGTVRLVDPGSGREYARLEDPDRDRPRHMIFTPDGSRLVTTNSESHSIHVWDLRAIRQALAEMGLDWNLPSYPPADASREAAPLRLELDTGAKK